MGIKHLPNRGVQEQLSKLAAILKLSGLINTVRRIADHLDGIARVHVVQLSMFEREFR